MYLPTPESITAYHDDCLALASWPNDILPPVGASNAAEVMGWVAENHRQNGLLWAQEDLARRTTVADSEIAKNKRAIDGHNQARNDAIERIDELLLLALGLVSEESARTSAPVIKRPSDPNARLNSETAGSMIDRLSIISLKSHAMKLQSQRAEASAQHRADCEAKLQRLLVQRDDLASCLGRLLDETARGQAWFQVYRQFKMYNDPRLNPALIAEQTCEEL